MSLSVNDPTVINTFTLSMQFEWFEIKHEGLSEEERKEFNMYPKSMLPECECECEGCECKGDDESYDPYM